MGRFNTRCKLFLPLAGILMFAMALVPAAYGQEDEDAAYDALIAKGKAAYNVRCALCHGKDGDGKGEMKSVTRVEKTGRTIVVTPWDFTRAVFRFRTTPTGCLPSDADLERTIRKGISASLMPAHGHIDGDEIEGIIEYIKWFSEDWDEFDPDDESCFPVAINKPEFVGSADSIARGEVLFKKNKCFECHGVDGKGDGDKAKDLKDDWGNRILPFNFTTGNMKRESTAEAVYLTLASGLDGTAMPGYNEAIKEEEKWHIASYALKLMGLIKSEDGH
ncbi:MAG: c-type cytochrome [Nitrospira sp.]|nr:c-type cytochrome [bacterium]MBL7048521.1 c-type cytochrome [Nitrospira sp.]